MAEIDALEELNNRVNFKNKKTLVIILGETRSLFISSYLYKNENIDLVTIDPAFESTMRSKSFTNRYSIKIRKSMIPLFAEKTKIREVLLKHNNRDYDMVLVLSFNAHTHAGKFYDRVCTSAPKVFTKKIKICGACSDCHYPGFYKRQIKSTLLYPKCRRDGISRSGWIKDIHLSY